MNKKIIENAKNYVNMLLAPLENLYFHQYEHSLDVMKRAIELWEKEWLNKEEIEILALSWIFHDTWFVIQYDNNEYVWARIARNFLRWSLYPENKIKQIEEIILATDPNYKEPKNIFEKIIKDADLDNLGRDDFLDKANDLKKEREIIEKIKKQDPNWIHWILLFLEEQKFYTDTQKKERESKKQSNIKILKNMLKELEENEKI